VGRLATERLVRRAITEGQLRVHYQPIIDLGSRRAVGAEALVRILDPQLGLLLPDSFLDVSEETGLLTAIDEWVLAQAVDQATAWRARMGDGFSGVAVNITSRHLADVAFQRSVTDLLTEHDLPSDWLQFEVTERVLIEASNSAMTGLRALRDVGVQVGLDDFGTGYSSLAYLRQFPLNFVKIDKSFVQSLTHVPGEDAIVAAIIDLSHALGLTVVAEGVETPSQLETVTALGCDRAQGFLFARPGEPRVVEEFATSR
jgi:EAL domain-containing protein (putative c-di-GMP-specific phosphodiesterase class I)